MSSEKWLLRLLICVVCILCILAGTVYIMDPYLHYRITDDSYYLHYRFVVPGIIRNDDYDTVIIGSSMTQNFQMDDFRQKLDADPIKVTLSGMTLPDMKTLTSYVCQTGKTENFYICMDYSTFANDVGPEESILPPYLVDDSVWNDYRYWFGYETWMRFIPVDLAFTGLKAAGFDISRYEDRIRIDRLEEWGHNFTFSEEMALREYDPDSPDWYQDTSTLEERLQHNFLSYVALLDLSQGDYTFFFPPYSCCLWHGTENYDYMDEYMRFKAYVVNYFADYDNVRVFDFQCAPFTTDMNNYKDVTHYSPEINAWMVDCFVSGDYLVTSDTIGQSIDQLYTNLEQFRTDYAWALE